VEQYTLRRELVFRTHSTCTTYYVFETRVHVIFQEFPRTTVKAVTTTSQVRTTQVLISHANELEDIETDDEEQLFSVLIFLGAYGVKAL
jgi:hypothetical protein